MHVNHHNEDRAIVCRNCGEEAEVKLHRRKGQWRNGRTVCCNARWTVEEDK